MMPKKNDFYEQVYQVVRLIPKGRITSYGTIGKFLGSAKSARMVGWALNQSHTQLPKVPAHRVVNRQGLLTGKHHFPSNDGMISQLAQEGISVQDNRIVDFEKHFWDPNIHLSLET